MSLWTGRLVILGAALFFVGWGLVLLSGHGGDSTGGSEAVWEIGGLMVYGSLPTFVIAAATALRKRLGRERQRGAPGVCKRSVRVFRRKRAGLLVA